MMMMSLKNNADMDNDKIKESVEFFSWNFQLPFLYLCIGLNVFVFCVLVFMYLCPMKNQRGAEEGAEIDKWKCPAPSLCL